jgi:F0F1-type ATP synthase membrane subunit b/b'
MISLDGNVIVVFFVVWILLFVLTRLFFNPVRRVREAREKVIRDNKDAFENALDSYNGKAREVDQALKEARAAAESARASLEADAQKEKSHLIAEINAECRRQVEQAKADLDASVRGLKQKLESEAAGLAEQIEKKFLN